MRIERVTLEDFKGQRLARELGPLTLLTGPNGSGKTSVLEAVRYAVQGDTSAGATAEAAMGYMGPNGGAVRLDLSGGLAIRRGIIRDPRKLTLSGDVAVSTMPGVSAKDSDAEISRLCGDFAEMHDLGAFLSLSSDKRREYLLALCGASVTAAGFDLLGSIRAEFMRERDSLPEIEDAALEEMLADLTPIAASALTPADAVGKVAERIKTRIGETKAGAERARTAGLELSARKNAIHVAAVSVDEMQRRRAQAVSERAGMQSLLDQQRGKADAVASLHRTLEQRRGELREDQRELTRWRGAAYKTAEAAEWEAEAARLEAAAVAPAYDGSAHDAALAALADETAQVGGKLRACEADIFAAQADIRAAESAIIQIAGSAWTLAVGLLDTIADQLPPSLLDGIPEYATLANLLRAQVGGDATAHEQAKADAAARLQAAQADLVTLRLVQADIEGRYAAARKADADARSADQDARVTAAQNAATARRLRDSARRVSEGVRERDRAITRLDASCAGLADIIAQTEGEIQNLTADIAAAGGADLASEVAVLDLQIKEVDTSIEAKRSYETLDRELARMIADQDRLQTMHETAKALADACRVSRETFMADLIRPLLDGMARFLAGTGLAVEPYCRLETDRGKPILELGWVRDGAVRVALPTLSGGECGLFHAALAYSLVAVRRPPLRLLMIEAGELDGENLDLLTQAISGVADGLDTVLVATHLDGGDVPDGWTVIDCGATREAVTA